MIMLYEHQYRAVEMHNDRLPYPVDADGLKTIISHENAPHPDLKNSQENT